MTLPFAITRLQLLAGVAVLAAALMGWLWVDLKITSSDLKTCQLTAEVGDQLALQRKAALAQVAAELELARQQRTIIVKQNIKEIKNEPTCTSPATACDRRVRELYERSVASGGVAP